MYIHMHTQFILYIDIRTCLVFVLIVLVVLVFDTSTEKLLSYTTKTTTYLSLFIYYYDDAYYDLNP